MVFRFFVKCFLFDKQNLTVEWRKLLEMAKELSTEDAAARRVRRSHLAPTIIRQDPDRHMVVGVYGESVTQAIEEASML